MAWRVVGKEEQEEEQKDMLKRVLLQKGVFQGPLPLCFDCFWGWNSTRLLCIERHHCKVQRAFVT